MKVRCFFKYKLVLFAFIAGIFLLAWPSVWLKTSKSLSLSQAKASSNETDRLFESMGILKIHGIKTPVEIDIEDLNGTKMRMNDLKGKIVFLNFWTTWCPNCQVEMHSLEKLHRHFKDRQFLLVAVNLRESVAVVRKYVEKNNLSFTILLDHEGSIGLSFGVRAIPATFILDRKGALIGKALGPREWDSKKSFALFEHLIESPIDGTGPFVGEQP